MYSSLAMHIHIFVCFNSVGAQIQAHLKQLLLTLSNNVEVGIYFVQASITFLTINKITR